MSCCSSGVWNSFYPASHRRIKERAGGWAGEGGTGGESSPGTAVLEVQGWRWSQCCAWACSGLLWAKDGGSLLENFGNHPLSFLCFHKCPENQVWKPLKNPSSRECLVFSKPAVVFDQAKTTQQVCPELRNVFSCPQNRILWQITALPINKRGFTELWWKWCVWWEVLESLEPWRGRSSVFECSGVKPPSHPKYLCLVGKIGWSEQLLGQSWHYQWWQQLRMEGWSICTGLFFKWHFPIFLVWHLSDSSLKEIHWRLFSISGRKVQVFCNFSAFFSPAV